MTQLSPLSPADSAGATNARAARARDAALRLEAGFLSEMLKAAGLGAPGGAFSGGNGEDQFASFQREAIALDMARAGGLGLAEHFFRAMMEAGNDIRETG